MICGRSLRFVYAAKLSKTKIQPKEEVFGTDVPRTSGGHSRGYPDPKLRSGRSKSWKNKHLGADIHDPKARTSTTLRDFQKLRSEKLRAEFSFPKLVRSVFFEGFIVRPPTLNNCKRCPEAVQILGGDFLPVTIRLRLRCILR